MPTLTPELVDLYIKSAKPFAHSEAELRAIRLARQLNSSDKRSAKRKYKEGRGTYVGNIYAAAEELPPDKIVVDSWKKLILKEINNAFCLRTARYRKAVDVFTENANTLIGLLAGYIAAKLGLLLRL